MRRTVTIAAIAAALLSLAACGASSTVRPVGGCAGTVSIQPKQKNIVASASVYCLGGEPSAYSVDLTFYADGQQIGHTANTTIPDGKGYTITLTTQCALADYEAVAAVTVISPGKPVKTSTDSVHYKITSMSSC
jgi:hypothetical protein